jgi:hypothetical protein
MGSEHLSLQTPLRQSEMQMHRFACGIIVLVTASTSICNRLVRFLLYNMRLSFTMLLAMPVISCIIRHIQPLYLCLDPEMRFLW